MNRDDGFSPSKGNLDSRSVSCVLSFTEMHGSAPGDTGDIPWTAFVLHLVYFLSCSPKLSKIPCSVTSAQSNPTLLAAIKISHVSIQNIWRFSRRGSRSAPFLLSLCIPANSPVSKVLSLTADYDFPGIHITGSTYDIRRQSN